jgi:hypothetical protein
MNAEADWLQRTAFDPGTVSMTKALPSQRHKP